MGGGGGGRGKEGPIYFVSACQLHGRSQDFSKGGGEGGSHCVKQRVLAFSQSEYCRLFA